MGRWHRWDDDREMWRDLLIVWFHPDYRDVPTTVALGELFERRDHDHDHD